MGHPEESCNRLRILPRLDECQATRIYANPLENDPHIISGESGSVPLGLAYTALHDEDAKDLKEALKLE